MGTDELIASIRRSRQSPLDDAELDEAYRKKTLRQKHGQRGQLFWFVMVLMCVEVLVMFGVVVCQGIGRIPWTDTTFGLDKWVLAAFEAGVLLQTFGLAKIITAHLFPIRTETVANDQYD